MNPLLAENTPGHLPTFQELLLDQGQELDGLWVLRLVDQN
jgi:hypothetical protein